MKKLKTHSARLRANHARFPHELVLKIDGENARCEFCGRTPLVGRFDLLRTIDGKDEASCLECHQEGRTGASIMSLAMAMGGIRENEEFPLAPEDGTPRRQKLDRNCATCGKAVYYNPYKKKLIGAYNELLRGITVHEKCGVPRHA